MKQTKSLVWFHLLGKTYSKRPSDIVGINGRWAAYQFDVACLVAGADAESEAADDKREGKTAVPKREKDFQGRGALQQAAGGSFKKVKIKEDGTW